MTVATREELVARLGAQLASCPNCGDPARLEIEPGHRYARARCVTADSAEIKCHLYGPCVSWAGRAGMTIGMEGAAQAAIEAWNRLAQAVADCQAKADAEDALETSRQAGQELARKLAIAEWGLEQERKRAAELARELAESRELAPELAAFVAGARRLCAVQLKEIVEPDIGSPWTALYGKLYPALKAVLPSG